MVSNTDDMVSKLKTFTLKVWEDEPNDINSIRELKKSPMGNMPCVLYANFNLFWLGEALQVWRAAACEKKYEIDVICDILSSTLNHHAARLKKWGMQDTVTLMNSLQLFFEQKHAKNAEDLIKVLDAALIALDKMQNWLDAIIPWPELDSKLVGLRRVH